MNIHLLVSQCLHIVHLILQKISLIVIKVKTLWKDLKGHVTKIINNEKKKKMIPLTSKERKLHSK